MFWPAPADSHTIVSSTRQPNKRTNRAYKLLPCAGGDLVIYACGSGTLSVASEASFGFDTNGQVEDMYVSVRDEVDAGQLLAELDNTSQELEYKQAQRGLAELTSPYAIVIAEQSVAETTLKVDSAYIQLRMSCKIKNLCST
ncbi:MAG: biotin/lipoyl-binding protein [Anaerolineales bacterium]